MATHAGQGDTQKRYDWADDPVAQDVIDALRVIAMAQDNDLEFAKVARRLVEYAPDTNSNRGMDLLMRLISEAILKAEVR